MLSNIFVRLLTSVRPISNYQQHFLRLLSTVEPNTAQDMSNNRETGVVKRFSKEKGYGFISKNNDGTDCFVHFKNINATGFKSLEQGQEVEFTTVQGEKGLEARDVSIINTGASGAPFMTGSSNNDSTSSRFGFGGSPRNQSSSGFNYGNSSRNQPSSGYNFGGTTSSKLNYRQQDSTSNDQSFDFNSGLTSSGMDNLYSSRKPRSYNNDRTRETGSVKRWTEERGFGFIRRANGGPDLFCHVRSLKDGIRTLDEGQTVEFTIQRTDKGEEARDVTVFDGEAPTYGQQENTSPTNSDERQTGTVRKWIQDKGYGFLRRDAGGSDIFVHLRELADGTMSLEEGQSVEFNIISSEKGEIAQNVTVRIEA